MHDAGRMSITACRPKTTTTVAQYVDLPIYLCSQVANVNGADYHDFDSSQPTQMRTFHKAVRSGLREANRWIDRDACATCARRLNTGRSAAEHKS